MASLVSNASGATHMDELTVMCHPGDLREALGGQRVSAHSHDTPPSCRLKYWPRLRNNHLTG